MIKSTRQSGFSAVELLITLFVAGAFLISGYQLYAVVLKDSTGIRDQKKAANIANDYIQQFKSWATPLCTTGGPWIDHPISAEGLSNTTITVYQECPYGGTSTITKFAATVKYNTPQQTLITATYVYVK